MQNNDSNNNENEKPDPPKVTVTHSGNMEIEANNENNSEVFEADLDLSQYFEYMRSQSEENVNGGTHIRNGSFEGIDNNDPPTPPKDRNQVNNNTDTEDEFDVEEEGRVQLQVQLSPGMMMVPTTEQHLSMKHVQKQFNDNFTNQSIDPSTVSSRHAAIHSSNRTHHTNNSMQSTLLVRHITRAPMFLQEHDANTEEMSPALKRRLRDFRFAQRKRRERYGEQNPWGIIGLYDHLTCIRTDIEWAEDAAWRRENDQPYLSWQDFEEAKDTGFNQPFFTYFIMLVCTVCLVISIGLNGWTFDSLTNNPMIGPTAKVLIEMGAKYTPKIVYDDEWYRVFTAMVRK